MQPLLIDTHCHLTEPRLYGQLEAVLERAMKMGVSQMIAVGTTAESSRQAVEIAERFPQVHASVGIHPTYCHETKSGDWEQIVELSRHPRVVALGETGLDLYWKECPLELQQQSFHRHWRLSFETQLPVIIHMRECTKEVIAAIQKASKEGQVRGVLHSFAESWETAQTLLGLGLYISFAGMVTYKNADALREVASKIPGDRILVETDSPYLSPEPFRAKRPNEPEMVVHTAKRIASARQMSFADFADLTTMNAQSLFALK